MNKPNLDAIDNALFVGLTAALNLSTWLNERPEAYDNMRTRIAIIEQGVKAFETLRANLRDGRAHIQTDIEWRREECYCNATSHPPCSFCESGDGAAKEN